MANFTVKTYTVRGHATDANTFDDIGEYITIDEAKKVLKSLANGYIRDARNVMVLGLVTKKMIANGHPDCTFFAPLPPTGNIRQCYVVTGDMLFSLNGDPLR